MHIQRPNPRRGLFAGLLALIAFASTAVGMTTGAPSGGTTSVATQASTAQTVVRGQDVRLDLGRGDGDGESGGRGDGGRHR
jgi:hypothetical protein